MIYTDTYSEEGIDIDDQDRTGVITEIDLPGLVDHYTAHSVNTLTHKYEDYLVDLDLRGELSVVCLAFDATRAEQGVGDLLQGAREQKIDTRR